MKNSIYKTFFLIITVFLFSTAIFAAGIIDQTFGTNGTLNLNFGTNTNVVDVDVNANGKIIVAGTVANANAGNDIFVAQFNSNGTLDTDFGVNGVIITVTNLDESINDLEIQPDGKIVLVGRQQLIEGVNTIFDFLVVRYDAKGKLDNTFSDDGFVTVNQNQPDVFTRVTVLPNGKIVAIGTSDENGAEIGFLRMIFRFNPNGTLDTSFATFGYFQQNVLINPVTNEFATGFLDIEALPDNRFVVGYNYFRGLPDEDISRFTLNIFSINGQPNTDFSIGLFQRQERTSNLEIEVLSNSEIAVSHFIGVYVMNFNLSNSVKRFNQVSGYGNSSPNITSIDSFNTGGFVVSGGQFGATTKTYSSKAFVGSAINLPVGNVVTQTDRKFIILANNSLTRVKNLTSQATRIADFDGDSKTDLIVDRSSNNTAYFLRSNGSYRAFTTSNTPRKFIPEYFAFQAIFALNQNLIVYRSQGIFYPESGPTISLGNPSDKAIGGDYDGDGLTNYSIFTTNGDWISEPTAIPFNLFYHWGTTGDKPVPADYDYDGITDYAVFRPSTGYWWIHRSSNDSYFGFPFGIAEDIPLTGDYDGDGFADFVVFRPSTRTWYMLMTTDGFRAIPFGLSTDIPVPGDYDGDGKHDIGVFRNGNWYILQSRDGFAAYQWGTTGDIPVTVRYDN